MADTQESVIWTGVLRFVKAFFYSGCWLWADDSKKISFLVHEQSGDSQGQYGR